MIESPSRLEVIPIKLKDTISWLILINSKSFDNHLSLPSREEAPVGIGLSLLFHKTLSVISSCGWSDYCFDVFVRTFCSRIVTVLPLNCSLFPIYQWINLRHWGTLCHFASKGCFVPWQHSHLWRREINVNQDKDKKYKPWNRDLEKRKCVIQEIRQKKLKARCPVIWIICKNIND